MFSILYTCTCHPQKNFVRLETLVPCCASMPNSVVPCWPSTVWHASAVDVVHAQCTLHIPLFEAGRVSMQVYKLAQASPHNVLHSCSSYWCGAHIVLPSDKDDLFDVKSELTPVSANWKSIGIALGLPIAILDCIHAEKPSDCLTSMATEWLKRNYNEKRFGEPSWQRLVEAVGDQAGGADMALAMKIASRHKARGMSSGYTGK